MTPRYHGAWTDAGSRPGSRARIESGQQNHHHLAIDVESAAMQSTELQDAVDAISWYHKMELPGGILTPGESDTARGLPRLRLPERLDG
jgi:hypothetical protein